MRSDPSEVPFHPKQMLFVWFTIVSTQNPLIHLPTKQQHFLKNHAEEIRFSNTIKRFFFLARWRISTTRTHRFSYICQVPDLASTCSSYSYHKERQIDLYTDRNIVCVTFKYKMSVVLKISLNSFRNSHINTQADKMIYVVYAKGGCHKKGFPWQ
jgi:competence transcription factor ComK